MTDLAVDVRKQIAEKLPDLLAKALTDYQNFLNGRESNDAKSFKEHHDACKAALAHIALFVKTAEQIGGPEAASGPNQQKILEALLAEAQEELENHENTGS